MSEELKIFDAMLEMRDRALRAGRTPRRWEINSDGLTELMMDERTPHQEIADSLLGKPFMGIPVARMPTPGNGPQVDLIVDETTPRR